MTERIGLLDSYHMGEAFKSSALLLGKRCGSPAIILLSSRLQESIGTATEDRHSYIWRAAIEDHEQNQNRDDYKSVLLVILRDALRGYVEEQPLEAQSTVRSFLESPYPTMVRLGIHACSSAYANMADVFWDSLKDEWFIELPFWHELYWLVKKNFPRFSTSERKRYLEVVSRAARNRVDKVPDELDNSHLGELLQPAAGQGDAEIDLLFSSHVKSDGEAREHPDFHFYLAGAGWIGEKAPTTADAILGMSDQELLETMNSFQPEANTWNGPTRAGLAISISEAVRASEDGFSKRLSIFENVHPAYQHGLLRGLRDRWVDDKRFIDWSGVLSLTERIVSANAFGKQLAEEPSNHGNPTVDWVISDIADLIKVGVGDKSPPMNSADCDIALTVLLAILEVTKPEEAEAVTDAVSHAINSPRGRTLETIINLALSLRRKEIADDQNPSLIWERLRPYFEQELETSALGHNAEFATMGGLYCANLHFLSPDWVEKNFEKIFPIENKAAWKCAAQGFSYQHYLYEWFYTRLRSGGHLARMIQSSDLPDTVSTRAVQFVGLAYMEGMENIDAPIDGLLKELIAAPSTESLTELCWFFWTMRGDVGLTETKRKKILAFWLAVSSKLRIQPLPYPKLQSALNFLAAFVEEVDASLEKAWTEAAPYAQTSHHGYILVEHLARIVQNSPEQAYRVFRAALMGFFPDFRREDIVLFVERLAQAGFLEQAEAICVEYAKHSPELLRETYRKLRDVNRNDSE